MPHLQQRGVRFGGAEGYAGLHMKVYTCSHTLLLLTRVMGPRFMGDDWGSHLPLEAIDETLSHVEAMNGACSS